MVKLLLRGFSLILLMGSSVKLAYATVDENQAGSEVSTDDISAICVNTRFYHGLSDDEKRALDHLLQYHHDSRVCTSMRAISTLEKIISMPEQHKNKPEAVGKLASLVRAVRAILQEAIGTRIVHGGVLLPIFNCCTPRDAYFREVVTNILTVTGNATIAGNLTVGGNLVITGTVTEDNLVVTGTIVTGNLIVLNNLLVNRNEIVNGNESVLGNVNIGGTLTVTGTSTFNNAVGITSTTAGTALSINEGGGTGVGLSVTGNGSQAAIAVTQGAGQNAIVTGTGTVAVPAYSFTTSPTTGLYSPGANRFSLTAGGVDKVNYDGSSVLVSSIYRFSAQVTADQALPANTQTAVIFPNVLISSANYNSGTGVYTAPVAGTYLVAFTVVLASTLTLDTSFVYVVKNGVLTNGFVSNVVFPVTAGVPITATAVGLLPLVAGDTLQVRCNGSSTGGQTVTVQGSASGTASISSVQLLSV
jgi:hypothetical protein